MHSLCGVSNGGRGKLPFVCEIIAGLTNVLTVSRSVQDYHLYTYSAKHDTAIEQPPNPDICPGWYGEIWVQYPQGAHMHPTEYGQIFRAKCELSTIISSICAHAYGSSYQTAGYRYQKGREHMDALMSWYASLPESLSPKHIVYPAQLKLQ